MNPVEGFPCPRGFPSLRGAASRPGPGGSLGGRICARLSSVQALGAAEVGGAPSSCISRCVARSPAMCHDIIPSLQVMTQTFLQVPQPLLPA